MTNEYKKYLSSIAWKRLRLQVKFRDKNKCVVCHDYMSDVHHIKYEDNMLADNINNVVCLCRSCHKKVHGIETTKLYLSRMKLFGGECWILTGGSQ